MELYTLTIILEYMTPILPVNFQLGLYQTLTSQEVGWIISMHTTVRAETVFSSLDSRNMETNHILFIREKLQRSLILKYLY